MNDENDCPICEQGQGVPLGQLGDRVHVRCRDCGALFSYTLEDMTNDDI